MQVENFKILVDLPSDQPALGFDSYASALCDVIEKSEPQFVVGIFGGWGSGKTTLMRAIEKKLNSEHCIPIHFSAWRYEKEEHLVVPMLDVLRAGLFEWSKRNATRMASAATAARRTAAIVGNVIRSLLAGISFKAGLPNALEVSFEANEALAKASELGAEEKAAAVPRSFYNAAFTSLQDSFREFLQDAPARRVVVFIDDLDRCLPQGALAVMESMKLFFDLRGFVFVVGLDRQVVTAAIDSKYADFAKGTEDANAGRVRGTDYIKKIFQVPFGLFPVAKQSLGDYVDSLCAEAKLPPEQEQDLRTRVQPHLEFLVAGAGVNPREVKRYINAYTLLLKMMSHRITPDPDVILCLQTIEFRPEWKPVGTALLGYREAFRDALRGYFNNDRNALSNLSSTLNHIPSDFLQYVSHGCPGDALLEVHSLDEYVYASEMTRSVDGPGTSDLVRDVTRLRPGLDSLADLLEQGSTLSLNQQTLQQTMGALEELLGRIQSMTSLSHRMSTVESSLRRLERRVRGIPDMKMGSDDMHKVRTEFNESLDQIISGLLNMDR